MSRKPSYRPEGYHAVTPFLTVRDVRAFVDFARQALGAALVDSVDGPGGSLAHAEVRIGDSPIMVGPAMGGQSPSTAMLYLYVEDVDAAYERAIGAGATSTSKPNDEFWGDRAAAVTDSFGNVWWIATRVEEVPHDELQRRSDAMMGSASAGG